MRISKALHRKSARSMIKTSPLSKFASSVVIVRLLASNKLVLSRNRKISNGYFVLDWLILSRFQCDHVVDTRFCKNNFMITQTWILAKI